MRRICYGTQAISLTNKNMTDTTTIPAAEEVVATPAAVEAAPEEVAAPVAPATEEAPATEAAPEVAA